MAFQSPYRGEEPLVKMSPQTRNLVSRLMLLIVGIVLTWVSFRTFEWVADGGITYPTGNSHGSYRRSAVPALAMLFAGLSGILGVTMIVAAALPLRAMHKMFDRWYRPPVTGDRNAGDGYSSRWWW